MFVKVCGITRLRDARLAAKLGADAVGFIFAKSPRRITVEKAASIIKKLPRTLKKAGVFVDEKPETINEVIKRTGINVVQLSGMEKPSVISGIKGARVIKALHVKEKAGLLKSIRKYKKEADMLLLDTYVKGKKGGTGRVFDWKLVTAAKKSGARLIAAGGVNPYNVGGIVTLRPFGIDVSSGVESAPGIKSAAKLKKLFREIRRHK